MRRITGTALLLFVALVTGCGGGGDEAPALGSLSSKLFVADSANFSIASTIDANPPAGTLMFDRVITGLNTTISNDIRGLVVDAANRRLYVAHGDSILVFDDIDMADGDVAPSRTITSASFGNITSLHLDTTRDILYAGDFETGIWVIDDASSADGLIVPDREITDSFGGTSFQIRDIFVDATRNILYVSRSTSAPAVTNRILVFANASTLDGSGLAATRTITPSPAMVAGNIFVDTINNRLYMADTGSRTVPVFDGASTASGAVSASRTINWGASAIDIAVDIASDRLYAINADNLFIIDGASTINGAVTAKTLSVPGGSVITALAINP
jgi:hypothetical protein